MLPKPINQRQEILLTLIEKGKVSIEDYYWMCGFRTRISELSKVLNFDNKTETKVNKHGNTYSYVVHSLSIKEICKAIKLYKNGKNN